MTDPTLAAQLIESVDTRFRQLQKMQPRTAYGVVEAVDVANQKASVYVSGDAIASPGFVYPKSMRPEVGARVRVVIDPRGDRYIERVYPAGSEALRTDGYIREIRPTTGLGANLAQVEGEANERIRDIMGSGYTSIQMGVGTATPVEVLRYNSDGTYALGGYGRLRYVPTAISVYSAATTTTRTEAALTPEVTALPNTVGLRLVFGTIRVISTSGAQASGGYLALRHWGGTGLPGIVYAESAVALTAGQFAAQPGGSNGRQLQVAVHAGPAGTLTYYLDVTGYLCDDN